MSRRALVIDDDPLVLEALASMLEELGCETPTARSANEALGQLAKDRSIEITVADINMPGLSGTELEVFGLNLKSCCCPAARLTLPVSPFFVSRLSNPICGESWQRQRGSASELRPPEATGH